MRISYHKAMSRGEGYVQVLKPKLANQAWALLAGVIDDVSDAGGQGVSPLALRRGDYRSLGTTGVLVSLG
jgi:hypothetical protein